MLRGLPLPAVLDRIRATALGSSPWGMGFLWEEALAPSTQTHQKYLYISPIVNGVLVDTRRRVAQDF